MGYESAVDGGAGGAGASGRSGGGVSEPSIAPRSPSNMPPAPAPSALRSSGGYGSSSAASTRSPSGGSAGVPPARSPSGGGARAASGSGGGSGFTTSTARTPQGAPSAARTSGSARSVQSDSQVRCQNSSVGEHTQELLSTGNVDGAAIDNTERASPTHYSCLTTIAASLHANVRRAMRTTSR